MSEFNDIKLKSVYSEIVIDNRIGSRTTDHKAVCLEGELNVLLKGPGYWKLNTSILTIAEYQHLIKSLISDIKKRQNLTPKLTWELLKIKIKECTIKFCCKMKQGKKDLMLNLEKELTELCQILVPCHEQSYRKNEIQIELNKYYDEMVSGAQIRARINVIEKGEASAKFYDGLEKARQTENVIRSLKLADGSVTNENREILAEMGRFYAKLYTSKQCNANLVGQYLDNIKLHRTLPENKKLSIEAMPEAGEFRKVIQNMNDNKSPGCDGIPIEFYKVFWADLEELYLKMIEECWLSGQFPVSMNTGMLTLIHKADVKDNLNNFRPISPTNCDYKIIAFVFCRENTECHSRNH